MDREDILRTVFEHSFFILDKLYIYMCGVSGNYRKIVMEKKDGKEFVDF